MKGPALGRSRALRVFAATMPRMHDLPEWHQVSSTYSAAEVINLGAIAHIKGAPEYAALRSYATRRRSHRIYGPMPAPVARIANRRLWLVADINEWLTVPIPNWRRNKASVQRWIDAGRPRSPAQGGIVTAPPYTEGETIPAGYHAAQHG